MAILKSLLRYLEERGVPFDALEHKTVYTALDKAATLHVRPQAVVKTVVVKVAPQEYAFALLPAQRNLDKGKLLAALNRWRKKQHLAPARQASLAQERWMRKTITGGVGATPPFGDLYGYPTVVDSSLFRQRDVFLNTGDYRRTLRVTHSRWIKALGSSVIKAAIGTAKRP